MYLFYDFGFILDPLGDLWDAQKLHNEQGFAVLTSPGNPNGSKTSPKSPRTPIFEFIFTIFRSTANFQELENPRRGGPLWFLRMFTASLAAESFGRPQVSFHGAARSLLVIFHSIKLACTCFLLAYLPLYDAG